MSELAIFVSLSTALLASLGIACTVMPRKYLAAVHTAVRYLAISGSLVVKLLSKCPAMRWESLLTTMHLAPRVFALQRPNSRASYSEALFVAGKSRRAAYDKLRPSRATKMATVPAPVAH